MKNCKLVDKHFIIMQHMVTYPTIVNGIIALAKLTTFKNYFQIETNRKIRQTQEISENASGGKILPR